MVKDDDNNSVCSNEEEVEVKDKEVPKKKVLKKVVKYVIGDDKSEAEDDEDEAEDEDEADEDEDEAEEAEEDEDDDEDDDDDDDDEYDPTIIQFEMLKNFFVDEDGTNVATHLGSISKELRTLNKILLKKNKD
jgi:hypothetical protein